MREVHAADERTLDAGTTAPVACGAEAQARIEERVVDLTGFQRSVGVGSVDADRAPPRSRMITAPSHRAITPRARQSLTTASRRGSRVVKYCAPWSKAHAPSRRVLQRPPRPRDRSNTRTVTPASARARAHINPARPAPTTATRGAVSVGGVVLGASVGPLASSGRDHLAPRAC